MRADEKGFTLIEGGSTVPSGAAINIGFADGHAQQTKLKDLWTLYWHDNWKPRTSPP